MEGFYERFDSERIFSQEGSTFGDRVLCGTHDAVGVVLRVDRGREKHIRLRLLLRDKYGDGKRLHDA